MLTKKSFFSSFQVMAAAVALMLCTPVTAQDIWEKERETAKTLVTSRNLEEEISFLSDTTCQGRATGTEGSRKAAEHIGRRFEEAGLSMLGESWFKTFHISHNLKGTNIMGFLPGSKSIPCDRYIIIGAHYDHLGTIGNKMYPGADANASGVAAMTALADMFGYMRKMGRILDCNIIFIAFDAREHGLKGSESLWNLIDYERLVNPVSNQRITKDKIALMVNIDQIGSALAPISKERPDYIIMLGTSSLDKNKRALLDTCNRHPDLKLDISLDYYGSANFTRMFYRLSDQKIFVDNKIPAVLFTSGITMNTNKTRDRVETLDMSVLQKRIWLMFHWIEGMINN